MNRQMNVGQLIEYLRRYEKHIPVYLDGAMAPDTGDCVILDCLRLDLELEDMKYNPDYNPDDWSD